MLFGLLYSLNDSDEKLKGMSKIYRHFLFASIVRFYLFLLKVFHVCFFMLSISPSGTLNAAGPSSM